MLQAANVVSLHPAASSPPSFVSAYLRPLWDGARNAFAVIAEVWHEARALERELMPRRISDC